MEGRALTVTTIVRSSDERDLAVCEWGKADGSPVFWLHGTPGSRYLRHVGDGYFHAGLRVITYDRPGYGRSARAPGRSVADVAADVVAIGDALGLRRFGVAGVSSGGPHALAVAALTQNRVTRCAAIVTTVPPDADGLDWYAGIDDEDRTFHQRVAAEGEQFLSDEFDEVVAWVESGMPDLDSLPAADHQMLVDTFREAVSAGLAGYVDDWLAIDRPWEFSVDDIDTPTRIMLARDDTGVPASHGDWYLQHLPSSELIWVDGGHFGPRDEPEMQLMAWVGGATD